MSLIVKIEMRPVASPWRVMKLATLACGHQVLKRFKFSYQASYFREGVTVACFVCGK